MKIDKISNDIEGIVTANMRIRQPAEEKTTPENLNEQEIAGYRDVLSIIRKSFDTMITENYILQLHKILYSHCRTNRKCTELYHCRMDTLFTPLAPYETPEAKIAKNKDLYYDSLRRSQIGPHEGAEDKMPFIKYLSGTILAAYKDFENRFSIVPAAGMVRKAVQNKIGKFTKQDNAICVPHSA